MKTAVFLPLLLVFGEFLAAQPPDPIGADSVSTLVKSLSAPDFRVREDAATALASRGPDVAAELQQLRSGLPLEAQLRIDQVLKRLVSRDAPRPVGAPKFSRVFSQTPVNDILKWLTTVGGTEVAFRAQGSGIEPHRTASITLEKATFFEALDKLCAQEELVYYRDYRSGGFLLSSGTPPKQPVRYAGGLRIALTSVSVTRSTQFRTNPSTTAHLGVRIDLPDRLLIPGMVGPIAPKAIVDEKDRSLLSQAPAPNHYLMKANQQRQFNSTLRMEPPEKDAQWIRRLEFELPMVWPTATLIDVIHDPTPPTENDTALSIGPLGLQVLEWQTTTNGQMQLKIGFRSVLPEGDSPTRIQIPATARIEILNEQGSLIRPVRTTNTKQKDLEVRTFTLPIGSQVHEIRAESLATYKIEKVPVVFENIALP